MDKVRTGELVRSTFGVEDGFDMLIVSQAVVTNREGNMRREIRDDGP